MEYETKKLDREEIKENDSSSSVDEETKEEEFKDMKQTEKWMNMMIKLWN